MGILSIISYNCEGINHQRKDFLQDVIKRYQPIFLCLQETWLLDSNSHVLNDVSSHYKPFSVSGVDEQDKILAGRVPGGVAVLVNTDVISKMKPIVLSSRRICAVECVHNGRNVVIASV